MDTVPTYFLRKLVGVTNQVFWGTQGIEGGYWVPPCVFITSSNLLPCLPTKLPSELYSIPGLKRASIFLGWPSTETKHIKEFQLDINIQWDVRVGVPENRDYSPFQRKIKFLLVILHLQSETLHRERFSPWINND